MEGEKEIEIRNGIEMYGTKIESCAVLCESGLVERAVLVGCDGGIEGTNHW